MGGDIRGLVIVVGGWLLETETTSPSASPIHVPGPGGL